MSELLKPKYRFSLRGRIHSSGFRTVKAFAKKIGVDASRVSRICSGFEFPSEKLAQSMARELGMPIEQFNSLL